MTVEYLFTTLILGMAIVHLVCRAVEQLAARFAGKRGHLEGLRNRTTRRDDWYVFFHRSALTGDTGDRKRRPPVDLDRPATRIRQRQRRRPAPRLHLV